MSKIKILLTEHGCICCGNLYDQRRADANFPTWITCGDRYARNANKKLCVAPAGHKQGDTLITDKSVLRQQNPKRYEGGWV